MIQPSKSNRPVLLDERTIAIHFLAGVAGAGLGDNAKRPQFGGTSWGHLGRTARGRLATFGYQTDHIQRRRAVHFCSLP